MTSDGPESSAIATRVPRWKTDCNASRRIARKSARGKEIAPAADASATKDTAGHSASVPLARKSEELNALAKEPAIAESVSVWMDGKVLLASVLQETRIALLPVVRMSVLITATVNVANACATLLQ